MKDRNNITTIIRKQGIDKILKKLSEDHVSDIKIINMIKDIMLEELEYPGRYIEIYKKIIEKYATYDGDDENKIN